MAIVLGLSHPAALVPQSRMTRPYLRRLSFVSLWPSNIVEIIAKTSWQLPLKSRGIISRFEFVPGCGDSVQLTCNLVG